MLAIVGGSARAALHDALTEPRLRASGIIAVDRFGDVDVIDRATQWIDYDDDGNWIDRLMRHPVDTIMPVGGFRWPSDPAMRKQLETFRIAHPEPKVVQAIQDPRMLATIAIDAIRLPWTSLRLSNASAVRVGTPANRAITDGWLEKPVNHAGGVDIRRVAEGEPTHDGVYHQQKIRGHAIGANFIAVPRDPSDAALSSAILLGAFGGLTYRRSRSHPFLYGGSFGPLVMTAATRGEIESLGNRIAAAFGIRGLFNVDLILARDESLWLLEINPRYSASMELLGTGSLVDWHLRCIDGDRTLRDTVQNQIANRSIGFGSKRIIYANHDHDDRMMRLMSSNEHRSSRMKIVDIPQPDAAVLSGHPICTLITNQHLSIGDAIRVIRSALRT